MANERMVAICKLEQTIPDYQEAAHMAPDERRLMDHAVDDLLQWVAGSMEFHQLSTRHLDHVSGRDTR